MAGDQIVAWILLFAHIAIVCFASVIISLRRKPQTALAWIMAIIFIPLIGVTAFLLIGAGRLPRRRREKQHEVNDAMLARTEIQSYRVEPETLGILGSAVLLNETLGALPMVADNTTALIEEYTGSFDQMIADIDTATDYVHVEFYILVKDEMTEPFFDALARAAQRGVHVRVLSDFISGFMYPHRKTTQEALSRMGAEWHPMLPLKPWRGIWQRPDLRNHRKLVVIDGRIGYTGSQNLIDETYLKAKNIRKGLHWVELMLRVEGPSVGELDAVFVADWFSETDEILSLQTLPANDAIREGSGSAQPVTGIPVQVIPSGPSFENDNNLKLFVLLLHSAQSRISITSPYFVPDDSTLQAIVTAASRGIDVELFVSEAVDQVFVHYAQRSYYQALLEAGVAIYRYRSPAVLHSKHFSIDDRIAVVGSSNMDMRSFSLNMEVSLLIDSEEFVQRIRLVEDSYRRKSAVLTAEEWKTRPVGGKILEGVARLTSTLQ